MFRLIPISYIPSMLSDLSYIDLLTYPSAEQRKAALRRIEMELDEADEMVSQMEIEIQGIPQALRPGYAARIKSAKAELAKGKKAAKDVHTQAGRSELLGRGASKSTSAHSYS
jgi:vesicle transport through interaction with t-SNAREs protein 1